MDYNTETSVMQCISNIIGVIVRHLMGYVFGQSVTIACPTEAQFSHVPLNGYIIIIHNLIAE